MTDARNSALITMALQSRMWVHTSFKYQNPMSVSGEAVEEDTDLRANTVGSGWALTLIISLSVIAWAQARKTERQAVVGAGAGAVIGGAVGRTVGSITNGVIVGAIVGGAAGAMIRVRRARLDGADVPAPNP